MFFTIFDALGSLALFFSKKFRGKGNLSLQYILCMVYGNLRFCSNFVVKFFMTDFNNRKKSMKTLQEEFTRRIFKVSFTVSYHIYKKNDLNVTIL